VARSAAALDAGMVVSGASIKPSEPGEVLHREALDAADALLDVPRRVVRFPHLSLGGDSMNRTTWLQDRRMQKFLDVLSRPALDVAPSPWSQACRDIVSIPSPISDRRVHLVRK